MRRYTKPDIVSFTAEDVEATMRVYPHRHVNIWVPNLGCMRELSTEVYKQLILDLIKKLLEGPIK
jgi:hypothetical protein